MAGAWGSFTFRDEIPSSILHFSQESGRRVSLASALGTIDMFQGQPRRLLVPGLVQCLAGPVWVEQCRLCS